MARQRNLASERSTLGRTPGPGVQVRTEEPSTDDDLALVDLAVELDLGDADVDYDALYG